MPIRFRCAYCNQLMGIARRKAGTVVRCPKCAGQVVVPQPEGPDEEGNQQDGAEIPNVFENSDFGKILDQGAAGGPHAPAVLPAAGPRLATPEQAEFEPVSIGAAMRRQRGIFLTSGMLLVISALIMVLMGLAFFLGLLLGKSAGP